MELSQRTTHGFKNRVIPQVTNLGFLQSMCNARHKLNHEFSSLNVVDGCTKTVCSCWFDFNCSIVSVVRDSNKVISALVTDFIMFVAICP